MKLIYKCTKCQHSEWKYSVSCLEYRCENCGWREPKEHIEDVVIRMRCKDIVYYYGY